MWRNDDYTIRNLLDYLYYQKYYKVIRIDLPRQNKYKYSPTNNFTGKLEDNDSEKPVFIGEKQ